MDLPLNTLETTLNKWLLQAQPTPLRDDASTAESGLSSAGIFFLRTAEAVAEMLPNEHQLPWCGDIRL